jgi:hypothetical protein
MLMPAVFAVDCVIVSPAAIETFPVHVVAPVTVRAPTVVVPAFDPLMKWPPAAPGAMLAMYSAFPIELAVVKSPATASCHTPVAIWAAVSWFVTVVTVPESTMTC